ncbi:MAG: hypothetical protein IBX68_12105, partial [Dehalococcoidia bacterium]|nr:hypothetical protein [Dehalococcoidia bacterium]
MYTILFELCDIRPDEIAKERPRIKRAFKVLGIEEKDITRGESRLRQCLDVELLGVRKFLGIWMR